VFPADLGRKKSIARKKQGEEILHFIANQIRRREKKISI